MKKYFLTHEQVLIAARIIAADIDSSMQTGLIKIYGVPRGGIPVAYLITSLLRKTKHVFSIVSQPEDADVIVDDIIDSGKTRDRFLSYSARFYALFRKADHPDQWLVFPWEVGESNKGAEDIPIRLLQYIGEDVIREGLKDTPSRFLKAWDHYASGYSVDPKSVLKTFEDGADNYDQMIIVKNIPVYSHCEHHLAPFFGVAHVGYIPNGRIVGLSKLKRLVDVFARRLQVQERLTSQIADAIEQALQPLGVGVRIECRHLCMESRGIQCAGSSTITSAVRGCVDSEPSARAEFFELTRI